MDLSSESPITLKLVIVGEKMVGKTSIINRYFYDKFTNEYLEEIWLKVTTEKIRMVFTNKKEVTINYFVYDLGSEETFEDYFQPFSEGANGILIVYDITRENTFDSIDDWIRKLRAITHENVIKKSILIGNKSDLSELREVTPEEGVQKAKELDLIQHIETSAKNNERIADVFEVLVENIISDLS